MKEYITEQRRQLLNYFENHCDEQLTINDMTRDLRECGISRSAVYRNVDRMVNEGILRRASEDGRRSAYQYVGTKRCCNHIHIQCTKCGRISHIEDERAERALKLALQRSKFKIDEQKTVLYGICSKCS